MTPRRRKSRIYWRARGGGRRAWADFRDYVDVGGRQEALVAPGQHVATSDPDVAAHLVARRLAELDAARHRRLISGRGEVTPLAGYASNYLVVKKRAGRVGDGWLAASEGFLRRAIDFFGGDRPLEAIRVGDVR